MSSNGWKTTARWIRMLAVVMCASTPTGCWQRDNPCDPNGNGKACPADGTVDQPRRDTGPDQNPADRGPDRSNPDHRGPVDRTADQPDMPRPDTSAVDSAPDADTAKPDQSPPDLPVPDQAQPDRRLPDSAVPDQSPPDQPRSDGPKQDGSTPGATCPGSVSKSGWCWLSPLPNGNDYRGVFVSGANSFFAVGEFGVIVHYNGSRFVTFQAVTDAHLNAVYGTQSGGVWAVGEDGTILQYDNGAWKQRWAGSLGKGYSINDLWGYGDTFYAVVGHSASGGKVITWSKTTGNWSIRAVRLPGTTTAPLTAIWGAGPSSMFVAGEYRSLTDKRITVLHYDGTWKERSDKDLTQKTTYVAKGLHGTSKNNVVLVTEYTGGGSGDLFHFDGASWTKQTSLSSPKGGFQDVWMSKSGNEVVASTYYELSPYSSSNASWLITADLSKTLPTWTTKYAVAHGGSRMRGATPKILSLAGTSLADLISVGSHGLVLKNSTTSTTRLAPVDPSQPAADPVGRHFFDVGGIQTSSGREVYIAGTREVVQYSSPAAPTTAARWKQTTLVSSFSGTPPDMLSVATTTSGEVVVAGESCYVFKKTLLGGWLLLSKTLCTSGVRINAIVGDPTKSLVAVGENSPPQQNLWGRSGSGRSPRA